MSTPEEREEVAEALALERKAARRAAGLWRLHPLDPDYPEPGEDEPCSAPAD